MRLDRLEVAGFRNLRDAVLEWPPQGALLLGANGQGKTNLLEAVAYPALFRSLRGAPDAELAAFGGTAFRVAVEASGGSSLRLETAWHHQPRRKQVLVDGATPEKLAQAVGHWLVVGFLPTDVALAAGGASQRRRYLDRMLSVADPRYLAALLAYRAALAQRNAALRARRADLAAAFDAPLARAGARIMARRVEWALGSAERFATELRGLGESAEARLEYAGDATLSDVEAWGPALRGAGRRDAARGLTTVGPHRDDLRLLAGGRPLRTFGSSGQHRSAAIQENGNEQRTEAAERHRVTEHAIRTACGDGVLLESPRSQPQPEPSEFSSDGRSERFHNVTPDCGSRTEPDVARPTGPALRESRQVGNSLILIS